MKSSQSTIELVPHISVIKNSYFDKWPEVDNPELAEKDGIYCLENGGYSNNGDINRESFVYPNTYVISEISLDLKCF